MNLHPQTKMDTLEPYSFSIIQRMGYVCMDYLPLGWTFHPRLQTVAQGARCSIRRRNRTVRKWARRRRRQSRLPAAVPFSYIPVLREGIRAPITLKRPKDAGASGKIRSLNHRWLHCRLPARFALHLRVAHGYAVVPTGHTLPSGALPAPAGAEPSLT